MKRDALILLTTSLAAFLTPFVSSAVSFAVPVIGKELHLSFYQAALLPLVILIPLASFMLLFGRLSDQAGRVLMFRLGLLIFSIGALLSIISKTFGILVASLFILGTGSSMMSANATAIVSVLFNRRRGFALGINAMSVYLGLTTAPFVSGLVTEYFAWRYLFVLVIPIALVSFFLSLSTLHEIRGAGGMGVSGSLLLALLLATISLYLSLGYVFSFLKLLPLLFLFLVAMLLFLLHERRSENPLISLGMMKMRRTFIASNTAALLNYLGTFSVVFVFSIYLQVTLHIPPFLSGLYILPEPVLMVLVSPLAGRLSDDLGSREIASIGMVMIGLAFISFFILRQPSVDQILLILAFLGVGFGLFSAPNTNSVMASIRIEFSGFASGFLGTMRFLGQLFSIIAATSLFSLAIPRNIMIGVFSGVYISIGQSYFSDFIAGFREIMLFSAVISFAGALASIMRG
ncbi:MAG: MFS transporter [Thermoplasmata archaeon]